MGKILDNELRKKILIDIAKNKNGAVVFSRPEQAGSVCYMIEQSGYKAFMRMEKRTGSMKHEWVMRFSETIQEGEPIMYYEDIGMIDDEESDDAEKVDVEKSIDWEQRRYEIAKDVLVALIPFGYKNDEYTCERARSYADVLINKLK